MTHLNDVIVNAIEIQVGPDFTAEWTSDILVQSELS